MTYLVIMTITSFLAILFFSIRSLIIGLVTGIFYFYFLLCVGALYERFLKEYNGRQKVLDDLAMERNRNSRPSIVITEPTAVVCNCKCHDREARVWGKFWWKSGNDGNKKIGKNWKILKNLEEKWKFRKICKIWKFRKFE